MGKKETPRPDFVLQTLGPSTQLLFGLFVPDGPSGLNNKGFNFKLSWRIILIGDGEHKDVILQMYIYILEWYF